MKCSVCGDDHPLEQLELTFKRPDAIAALDAEERANRCKESDDLAHIDQARWFVRGTIPLPVIGREREYRIGAWAEVDAGTFKTILDLWDDESQCEQGPLPGILANEVPGHPDSCGEPILLRLVGPETRPDLLLEDAVVSLGAEQAGSISEEQAIRYSSYIYHGREAQE